jgi:Rrf2 family protein
MKLSARSRYAARLLLELARARGQGPVSASLLAANTGVSVQFIEQILRPLRKAGFIRSLRGAAGGHLLRLDPAAITLGDVVRTLEGPVALARCCAKDDACGRADDCRTRVAWARISQALERAMDAITLADLVEPDRLQSPCPEA